jgi:hypothetical protein
MSFDDANQPTSVFKDPGSFPALSGVIDKQTRRFSKEMEPTILCIRGEPITSF